MPEGTTIWDAAKSVGIDIPVLCHDERYDPVGVCRVCAVDVGARVYAAACVRPCEDGMEVKTATPEVEQRRATLTQLLMADQPPTDEDPKETTTADNELLVLARRYGIEREDGIPLGSGRGEDLSNPVIAVNHDACILCDRCVRACDDIQGNDVIGRSGKGYSTLIAFDLNDPMGESSCVTCGECVAACPTGALVNKPINDVPIKSRTELDSVDTRLPVLRRRLRAHLPRGPRAQRDLVRRRPRAARLAAAPVREGPLRLGLRELAAASHDAADPDRGVVSEGAAVVGRARRGPRPAQEAGRARGLRRGDAPLPRGELGRGTRPGGVEAEGDPRRRRPRGDRRLRLGQVLERGGLPLPEADPRGLRHEQRGPLHAAVPRVERGGAVRGRRLGRRLHDLRRHHQRRRRDPGRHEHDREPPGRFVVLQAGEAARHEADRGGPAAGADRRPRRHLLPAEARHRRGLLQRAPPRGDRERLGRSRVRRRARDQLRRARQDGEAVPARARRPDLRRRCGHDPRGRAAVGRGCGRRHLLGHGHLAAHDRNRQRALPDRDVLDHRQRGARGHRAAPAARAEQRAGRVRRRA